MEHIMRCFAWTVFVLVLAGSTQGSLAAETAPGGAGPAAGTNVLKPGIQFASTSFDFGRILNGQQVLHSFVFTNTGKATLEIKGVYPSCGCTTAGEWSKQVEPGQTGTIPLQFNSSHFSGPVAKTATVVCNDESHPSVILEIKGTIWKPIDVNPQTAVLNVVSDSASNAPAIVRILNNLGEPITLSQPESNNRGFVAELKPVEAGKSFDLIIRAVPPLEQNNVQGIITLKTSSTNVPAISVTVFAIVQPSLVVMPAQIALPPGPLGSPFPCTITIRNNSADPVQLSDPVVNVAGVNVDLKEVMPGRQFTLSLNFPAGFQAAASEPVFVTAKTSNPKNPVVRIPIYQGRRSGPPDLDLPNLHRGPVPPPQQPVPHAQEQHP